MDGTFLNKNTSVALYRQLADLLRQFFRENPIAVGTRIPTEFELADRFGVSRGTIRHALSLLEKDGMLERVPGLGTFVRESETTRHIARLNHIGLIIPQIHDQLSFNIMVGVESVAKDRGFQVVFNHNNESSAQQREDILRMRADEVAGIILFPVSNQEYDETVWQLCQDHYPFVLVDRFYPDLDCDTVTVDNFGGGYRAAEHLILLDHLKIGFIYHPPPDFRTTSVRDRYRGYRKALADYHLAFQEDWLVQLAEVPPEAGGSDMLRPYLEYLSRPGRPTAVCTVNDHEAINLLAAAARLGIRVPAELAVVGFDNVKMASQIQYPLTTVKQEFKELGVRAAHLLLARLNGFSGPPEHIILPTSLIVRDSCGAKQRIFKKE